MITDQDITKLKTVFATKEDLEKIAAKADLKKFATRADLKILATKEALADLRLEVGELKDSMEEKFTNLDVKLDRFLGRLDQVIVENAAGAVAQYRHERHIQALADHVRFTLPEE